MAVLSSGSTELVTVVQHLCDLNKKYLLKNYLAAFRLWNLLLDLYVLLFAQGPTWESIMDTVTMQTLL